MTEEGATFIEKYNFEGDGEYALRVRAWGQKVGDEFPKMVIRVGGKDVKTFTGRSGRGQTRSVRGEGEVVGRGKARRRQLRSTRLPTRTKPIPRKSSAR